MVFKSPVLEQPRVVHLGSLISASAQKISGTVQLVVLRFRRWEQLLRSVGLSGMLQVLVSNSSNVK
jgi:hypothetical protein